MSPWEGCNKPRDGCSFALFLEGRRFRMCAGRGVIGGALNCLPVLGLLGNGNGGAWGGLWRSWSPKSVLSLPLCPYPFNAC